MDRYYKRLMNDRKTVVARFADALSILLIVGGVGFFYALVKSKSFVAAWIVVFNIEVIALLLLRKIGELRLNRFKKQLDKQIKEKLILERIITGKEDDIVISGYTRMGEYYLSDEGETAKLIVVYPQSVLEPQMLLPYIKGGIDRIIATCNVSEDSILLCKRAGIGLFDKQFILDRAIVDIDEETVAKEIETEVKELGEIKKSKKRMSFIKDRWSKYLLSCFVLLWLSNFMGRFKIIYLAFSGVCISFCFLSLVVSKSQ